MSNIASVQKYRAYAQASQTVAKTKQVVMLYDGAIRFIRQARDAITAQRYEERYNLLTKASGVISGLQGSIDFERGGEIAPVLYDFYSSIDTRLFAIHNSNSLTDCDQLIAELKEMRDAWDYVDRSMNKPQSHPPMPVEQNVAGTGSTISSVLVSA